MTKQIAAGEYGSIIEIEFDDDSELADSINFMSSEIERNISIKMISSPLFRTSGERR